MTDLTKKYEQYMKQMEDAEVDETIPVWNPESEGDILIGTIIDVQRDIGRFHSDIMTIETTEGVALGVWISQVIRSKMKRLGIRIGDVIGLKYGGMMEVEGGNSYKRFALKLLRKGPSDVEAPFDF